MIKRSIYRKQKSSVNHILLIAVGLIVLAGTIVIVGLIWQNINSPTTNSSDRPSFSLDPTQAPNWWTSGSSWPRDHEVDQYEDSPPLPLVSILAFQGVDKPGDRLDQCFISASYNEGSVDVSAAIQEKTDGMLKGMEESSSLEKIAEINKTLKTSEGTKEYTLHQFDLSTEDSVQKGNEFAYIQLTDGYVYIFGVCPTADMLESTENAISALELKL